ncbi:H-NS histone family protein (plasmid) [Burkholderia sp. FERM BP-3421]|uniref:H-NS histone family protein n=1 Tax=Burkholderia sp. FERM BP-3421 TaxID=1494466 RepID=UPI00235F41CF|nr:H-NS histone family protein [Burkholderia sp. FERM BP-3421]WDD90257.1 H-NS histone family protein [Burkholderia sp. FERM BP-3421]
MGTSVKELQAQLRDLNRSLADAKSSERQAFLLSVAEQVALYGIAEEELVIAAGFRKVRKRLPARYYDPSTGQKWSGRGPTPKWLDGKNLDHYRIDREVKTWWPEKN